MELELSLPNKNLSVGQTNAIIQINYSGLPALTNSSSNTSKTEYTNIELQYSFDNRNWYKIPDNYRVTRGSLTAGTENNITIYCRRSYTMTKYKKEPLPPPLIGYTDWQWVSSENKTDSAIYQSIPVFTRASTISWSWDAASGKYIDEVLTATRLTNWITYLRIYQSWYWQDDRYSNYFALAQSTDTDISATWYNNCYSARYNRDMTIVNGLNTSGAEATYISADLINDLNFSAEDWEIRNWNL